jgi:hypothetical protein
MPVRAAEAAIANFCRHSGDVLFSSSPFDYKEPTHVNVHPPEYWAAEFARHGFYRDIDFDASYITPWAARFRRSAEPLHRIVRNYERRFWELTVERNDTRAYSMDVQQKLAVAEDRASHLQQQADQARATAEAAEHAASAARADLARVEHELAAARTGAELEHARVSQVERDLAAALNRIAHMERSVFWRARTWWKRLTGTA